MNITIFRIDDRLIHGQIVTAWLNYADAKQIIVADDKAAKDTLQQSLLKMATPKGIELKIVSIEDAKTLLKEDNSEVKTLFLVRGPVEANEVIDFMPGVKSINVGNLNMRKGKEKVLGNLWVFPEDIEAFKNIDQKGIEMEFRTVPNDRSQSPINLLQKNKLI